MSRIDFRVDRHFYTTGYLGRRAWSVFGPESDCRPVSRARSQFAPVCDRWQPSATGSTPTTQSVLIDFIQKDICVRSLRYFNCARNCDEKIRTCVKFYIQVS